MPGDDGQLGHGEWEGECCRTPSQIPRDAFFDEDVVMVACGAIHAAAVTFSGKIPPPSSPMPPPSCPSFPPPLTPPRRPPRAPPLTHTHYLASSSVVGLQWGGHGMTCGAALQSNLILLTCAHKSSPFVGRLFTWGDGDDGQLAHQTGVGGRSSDEDAVVSRRPAVGLVPCESLGGEAVVMASCGESHTCAVTETGQLWTWGRAGLEVPSLRVEPYLVGLQQPLVLMMR